MHTFQTIKLLTLVFFLGLGMFACGNESTETTDNSDIQDTDTTQESNSEEITEESTENTEKPESINDQQFPMYEFILI